MKSILPLSVLFVLTLLAGCGRATPDSGASRSLPLIRTKVALVHLETAPVLTEITGTVHAVELARLAAKVMGSIDTMTFTLGQRVKRGDTLVTISAGEINARWPKPSPNTTRQVATWRGSANSFPKAPAPPRWSRISRTAVPAPRPMLREAKVMLGYTTLQAPFDGVIARKFANVGDLASPGLPLVEVEGLNGFEVQADVPDSLAGDLSAGKLLVVQTPTEGVPFSGKISEIASASDPNAHTFVVKITVPDGVTVRSGQFVRIQVPAHRSGRCWRLWRRS